MINVAEQYIKYDEPWDAKDLQDGMKLYVTHLTSMQPAEIPQDFPGDGYIRWADDVSIHAYMMFVASLNVDKKFKVYYNYDLNGAERIAQHGRKVQMNSKPMVDEMFSKLVAAGWEFTV